MKNLNKLQQLIEKETHKESLTSSERAIESLANLADSISNSLVKEDLEVIIDKFVQIIIKMQIDFDSLLKNDRENVSDYLNSLNYVIKEIENNLKQDISKSRGESITDTKKLSEGLNKEIREIRLSIPKSVNLIPLENDIDSLKGLHNELSNRVKNFPSLEKITGEVKDSLMKEIDKRIDELKSKIPTNKVIERHIGGASMVRVLNNGTPIGDTVTEINFVNPSSISYTSGATGRRANITTATGGSGGYTKETPGGAVNSSNTSFTVTAEPVYVIADGITYFDGAGYTYAGLTITMDSPPSQYIRSFY